MGIPAMPNALTSRLATMFGTPEFSLDPKKYLDEIDRLTKSYPEAVLIKAADMLVRTHSPTHLKPWPSPSDICGACADSVESVPGRNMLNQDWTREAVGTAYALLRSDLGRTAGDEGWVLSLWDFCRKKKRLPDQSEAHDCRVAAREFDAAYAQVQAGGGLASSLVSLGATMLARRDALARHAWGEDIDLERFADLKA